ncbi:MAG: hypothetical protein ACKOWI_06400 [Rhodoluna sp.]
MRKFSLVAVLVVVLTIPFPTSAQAACSQTAKVAGGSVTLCLSTAKPSTTPSSSTKTVTSVRTPTLICPGWVTNIDLLVAAILRGCAVPRLLAAAPAKPVATSTSKTTTTIKTTNTVISDQAAFTPDGVSILTPAVDYIVGASALLTSTAATHTRTATVLGAPAQVRFVPIAYRWRLDAVAIATSAFAVMPLKTAGAHRVDLEIDYEASYRIDLASPFISVGQITVSASSDLTATAPVLARARPHLVAGTCSTHPSSYRC